MSNKRYMDFVPKSTTKKPSNVAPKKGTAEVDDFEVNEVFEERNEKIRAGVTPPNKKAPKTPDYQKNFVRAAVPKRPLSRKQLQEKKAVQQNVAPVVKSIEGKPEQKVAPIPKPVENKTEVKPPKPQKIPKLKKAKRNEVKPAFVNTEKVAKRPLSNSVGKPKTVVPEETPSGPVTIIDKPASDSKVGLIITIILTIILGAAAGTVAFLLLPK